MALLVIFGMFIAHTVSHRITSLEVPEWIEPGRTAELRCRYLRQAHDPPLHSVKWYRGKHEIFRYTPQELEIQYFNSSGVSVTNSSCDSRACTIFVKPDRGEGTYTCEVSSERPRFDVDRQTANMTLAVLPQYDPLITDLPTIIYPDEEAFVNCTSDYSLPPAVLQWFVDDHLQEKNDGVNSKIVVKRNIINSKSYYDIKWLHFPNDSLFRTSYLVLVRDRWVEDIPPTQLSGVDGDGLRASWRTLRVTASAKAASRGYTSLRCTASVPTRPSHRRSMAVRLIIASRPHISKFTANVGVRRIPSTVYYMFWTLFAYLRNECLN